jgi:phage terminase large subunit-like protein
MSQDRNYVSIARSYAEGVVADSLRQRYCIETSQSCKRFLKDLERSLENDCKFYFDEWYASDVCDFIEKLPHVEGRWGSETIVLEPWQIFILVNIFGFRKKSDNARRFNTCYIEVGRKNAKSTLSAGICLYCLTCEDEPGPQIKTAATTGNQARIVFNVAKAMVEKTPELQEAFGIRSLAHSILCGDNWGSIQPINSKAATQDGLNPHMYVLDELHAHQDRNLFDVLKSARGARNNPLSLYITTAGYNVLGVCFEQRIFLKKVLSGLFEADHYFGIIFTLDKGDDCLDPTVWHKANPNFGVSVNAEEFEGYALEARNSPESLGEFKTKRCNVWTSAKSSRFNMEDWKVCSEPPDLELAKELQIPVYSALDLAAVSDINAFLLAWEYEGWIHLLLEAFVPEEVIEPRTKRGNVPYQVWVNQGWLTPTPGNVSDYTFIEKRINHYFSTLNIEELAFDRWNSTELTNRLMSENKPLVEFRQGTKSYSPAIKFFDRILKSHRFKHGGNPLLTWMVSNVVTRKDSNENEAPDRKNSQEKIDGAVAALMALGRMKLYLDEEDSSYLNETGPVAM